MSTIFNPSTLLEILLGFIAPAFIISIGSVRHVTNGRVAIVEKRWSRKGSIRNGLIALNGEVGFQPEILLGGFHFFFPFQYRIHIATFVTIPLGRIGYVFARDGRSLLPTQTLASAVDMEQFLDARTFLRNGGQKGFQKTILREGTHAINLAQFVVITHDGVVGLMLEQADEQIFEDARQVIASRKGFEHIVIGTGAKEIGLVTVHDGPTLSVDQTIAPIVGNDCDDEINFHDSFQDPEKFLNAGGMRGRQTQVLIEGTYVINRLFATVEFFPKTTITDGNVGVVLSHNDQANLIVIEDNDDQELPVENNKLRVKTEPLLRGEYPFNPYTGEIICVPTSDIQITETTKTIITKDGFEPILPFQITFRIDQQKAPEIVERFGELQALCELTLMPMVCAYFRNVGQNKTFVEFLQDRSNIQTEAELYMKTHFAEYDLEFLEIFIGIPTQSPNDSQIDKIVDQFRQRYIAEEQITTYKKLKESADSEKAFREAQIHSTTQIGILQEAENFTKIISAICSQYQQIQQIVDRMVADLENSTGDSVPNINNQSGFIKSVMALIASEKATSD